MSPRIEIHDSSAKYFFNLAICGEITHVINKLDMQSNSLSEDEKVTTTLTKNNLLSLKLLLGNKLKDLYTSECPYEVDGTAKFSKLELTEQLLVGKQAGNNEFPIATSTEDLLKVVSGEKESLGKFTESKPRGLYTKLRLMLLQALQLDPTLLVDQQKDIDDNLYPYLAAYCKEIGLGSKFTMVYDFCISYFDPCQFSQSISLEKLLSIFIRVLNSHLEILEVDVELRGEEQKATLDSMRELGNNLMANLAYAQAIKAYTQALEIKPLVSDADFPQLYTNRAIAFIGLNCVPEAITDLNMALVLNRVFTPAWTQLGYCHLYMGNSLVALKSYVAALKSAVGEILPDRFPEDETLIEKYKEIKKQTLLPQFVKRLTSAIALTEKRAYQQHLSDQEIRRQLSDVRRILAHLRALGPDSDRDDFTYIPVYRDSSLRDVSMRANNQRPNILTPEVTQNLLARNGMEASVITPIEPFRRRGDTRQGNGTPRENESGATFEFELGREMPNAVSLAEIFRSTSRNAPNATTTRNSETERNTEINRSSGTSDATRSEGDESRPSTQSGNEVPNRRVTVETNAPPTGGPNLGATIANVISQAFTGNDNDGGNGGASGIARFFLDQMQHADGILRVVNDNGRVSVNNVLVNTQANNTNSQPRDSNGTTSTNPSTDNDVEMGDVPDLD